MGSNFQFIDDLSELTEVHLSAHEKEVNPWILFPDECLRSTIENLKKFQHISSENNFKHLNLMVEDYYKKMLSLIESNLKIIAVNSTIEEDKLLPVILLMKSFGQN